MTKFAPEVVERIIGSMRAGVGAGRAAEIEGISAETMRLWRRKGEADPDGPYGRIAFEAMRCMAQFQGAAERCVNKAVQEGDVKAAQWLLERRVPDEYGPKQSVTVDGSAVIGAAKFDMDEITDAIREMRARKRGHDGQDEA